MAIVRTTLRSPLFWILLLYAIVWFIRALERDERKRRRLARLRVAKQRRAERGWPQRVAELHIGGTIVRVTGGTVDVSREPVDAIVIRARQRIEAM